VNFYNLAEPKPEERVIDSLAASAWTSSGLEFKPMTDTGLSGWLIVEDEGMIAMLVEDALEDMGLDVIGRAATVAQAMDLIEGANLQGAVLDVNLSGEKVYPVAAALARRNVPFIFLTGQGEFDPAGEHGAKAILQKPFMPDDIQATIRRLLPRA
jgi:DNA-binding response OmpR family regulator